VVRIVPLASKVRNCNENGCSTSSIHMSDCNMNDHAASDVCNVDYYEDENLTSPFVLRDMEQEEGATCTALDQSLVVSNTAACATVNQVLSVNSLELNVGFEAMGVDTNGERTDKESTSLILTSPQNPNSTDGETVNQLAIKARDSLEKKKKGSKDSSKKNKKSSSSPGGVGGHVKVIFVLLFGLLSIFV